MPRTSCAAITSTTTAPAIPTAWRARTIPIAARIVAAADAFVAMTENRPYEGPRGHREAVAELERNSGSQFDPAS